MKRNPYVILGWLLVFAAGMGVLKATTPAPQGQLPKIKKCESIDIWNLCQSINSFSACTTVGAVCRFCGGAPLFWNDCQDGSQLVECTPAGNASCGTIFSGTCQSDGMGGVFCEGGGSSNSCSPGPAHEC